MLIIFGWLKIKEPMGEVSNGYCYVCRRSVAWTIWKESEWVTFSDIRVFRFVLKHHFHCSECGDGFQLRPAEFRDADRLMRRAGTLNDSTLNSAFLKRIETQQLARKTETQLRYIRASMAAERDHANRRE